ncbi:hypothetical protein OF83DRAFT_1153013 [Amylostereum chailletii]|nr:hypothetical protein OF83DRAFT_1153013 [Amylostereum chailletii]
MQSLAAQLQSSAFVEVPKLIEKLFGGVRISKTTQQVYGDLVTQGVYIPATQTVPTTRARKRKRNPDDGPGSHWRGLPLGPFDDDDIQAPLCDILNKITIHTRERVRDTLDIHWRHQGKRSQGSRSSNAKPDMVATLLPKDLPETKENEVDNDVWWRFVHTVAMIKQQDYRESATLSLIYKARQMLISQPDRRFVYGLLFSKRNLTVWVIDRSGVLGSCAFDLHQDPRSLVRVVVGLLIKDPSEVGWDPSMLTYVEDPSGHTLEPMPSYDQLCAQRGDPAAYEAHSRSWVVEMNVPGEGDEPYPLTERFILFRLISISDSEAVWLSWKWVDVMNPEIAKKDRKVYVFKDCWRDEGRAEEGKLYDVASKGKPIPGVVSFYSYGIVRINGKVDDTLQLIRKSVFPRRGDSPLRLYSNELVLAEESWLQTRDADKAEDVEVQAALKTIFEDDPTPPLNRIHSRLVMSTYGRPLHSFKSLLELVGALHDIVAGHRNLYKNGVLHYDISFYNMLITSLAAPNRGVLIDLDNSKIIHAHNEASENEGLHGTHAFMSYEVLVKDVYFQFSASSLHALGLESDDPADPWLQRTSVQRPGRCRDSSSSGIGDRLLGPANVDEAINAYFLDADSMALAFAKRKIMHDSKSFAKDILANFSTYCSPLTSLARTLYTYLQHSYRVQTFTGLHDQFLSALKEVEDDSHTHAYHEGRPDYQRLEQAEITRRTDDEESWHIPVLRLPIIQQDASSSITQSVTVDEHRSSTHHTQILETTQPPAPKRRRTSQAASGPHQRRQNLKPSRTRGKAGERRSLRLRGLPPPAQGVCAQIICVGVEA